MQILTKFKHNRYPANIAALQFAAILVCTVAYAETFKDGVQLERGGPFPEIRINKLMMPEDYKRLALSVETGDSFSISDIPGDILLVEFFNRSCFTCIDQVPHLNSLVDDINNGTSSSDIKILGIAAGNGEAELLKFIKDEGPKYAITPDPEMEHYFTLGQPEGTPLILILKRSEKDGWLTMDSHLGLVPLRELRRKIKAIVAGRKPPVEEIIALPTDREAPSEIAGNPADHAAALFTRITGKETMARKVEVDYPMEVFQGVDSNGKPIDLFIIVATRHSLCDICHDSVFALAFNKAGIVKGFTPIYVTRYGNEKWVEADAAFMENKLIGESVKSFSLRPGVDAVSGATISSTVIFDEVKRTAGLLDLLP